MVSGYLMRDSVFPVTKEKVGSSWIPAFLYDVREGRVRVIDGYVYDGHDGYGGNGRHFVSRDDVETLDWGVDIGRARKTATHEGEPYNNCLWLSERDDPKAVRILIGKKVEQAERYERLAEAARNDARTLESSLDEDGEVHS